jgi:hypothetical protein
MEPAHEHARGACLCGALRFDATLPSKLVAHCHCSRCRRAHGAAFVTWAGFPLERFRIDDPERQLRWYQSSAKAERGFCAHCGSTLFFRSAHWPGEMHVVVSNFEDALDRAPQAHVYYDTHVAWFEVNDSLPKKPAPT